MRREAKPAVSAVASVLALALACLGLALPAGAATAAGVVVAASAPQSEPSPIAPRVIGGDPADITDVPWQVALLRSDRAVDYGAQFCGGSILTAQWIITAAHCIGAAAPGDIEVLAGKTTLAADATGSGPRWAVSAIHVHPGWNPATYANDVALLHLSEPLPLNGVTMAAISLPTAVDPQLWPAAGTPALVSGWGATALSPLSYPYGLRRGVVDVLTDPGEVACGLYGGDYNPATMLCAGKLGGGVDTCYGDSGGPLAVRVGQVWQLAGITSWGNDCALADYPGVYTRVTAVTGWVLPLVFPPVITAAPSALDFGGQRTGTESAPQQLTITNEGLVPLDFHAVGVGIAGSGAGQFVLRSDSCSGSSIPPGAACAVQVVFAPSGLGAVGATMTLQSNAAEPVPTVALAGAGVAPGVSFSPGAVAFGDQPAGRTANSSVQVTNSGTGPLDVPAGAVSLGGPDSGQFAISSDGCSAHALAPGQSCLVVVSFTPAGTGARAGILVLTNSAAGAPHAIALTGSGVAPGFSAAPSPVAFPTMVVGWGSAVQNISVTNSGTATLEFGAGAVGVQGADSAAFIITSDTCSQHSLAPGATCGVGVVFRPDSTGAKAALLQFTDATVGSPRQVALSGTGAPVSCRASAASRASRIKVQVGPALPGHANYTFRIDRRVSGRWVRILKPLRTSGADETRTVNVPRGTYRVKCYNQGYPTLVGARAGDAASREVRIRR